MSGFERLSNHYLCYGTRTQRGVCVCVWMGERVGAVGERQSKFNLQSTFPYGRRTLTEITNPGRHHAPVPIGMAGSAGQPSQTCSTRTQVCPSKNPLPFPGPHKTERSPELNGCRVPHRGGRERCWRWEALSPNLISFIQSMHLPAPLFDKMDGADLLAGRLMLPRGCGRWSEACSREG